MRNTCIEPTNDRPRVHFTKRVIAKIAPYRDDTCLQYTVFEDGVFGITPVAVIDVRGAGTACH